MAVAQRAMTAREWGLLALLALLWGGSFFFIGVAVKELPPLTLAALRVGLAALILWASAPLTGVRPPTSREALAALALLGVGNNALPFALIAWGQTHLPAGLASILNAATPLFAVLVAHMVTAEEKLSRFKIIGAAAGMAGVAWVIGPDVLWGRGAPNAWAEGAVLLAAMSYAVTAVFARRVGALGLKPLDVAAGQTVAGAIYLVPIALVFDRPWSLPVPSAPVIASVFAIAALCTALAYAVYFRILLGAGATNVLLVTLVAPATSVILGALILHERLLARQFVGFAIIGLGLAFIDGRLPRALLDAGGNSNLVRRYPRLPSSQKSR
jgi:drug/metabolite transporter (DMT)-like permease